MKPAHSVKQEMTIDTLIVGSTIITMDATNRIINDAALAISGDRIVFIGKHKDAEHLAAKETIDGRRFVITPGLIDGHVHVTGDPLTRGYVPDEIDAGFDEKLTTWVIPRYQAHTAADEKLSARLDALQMLRSGTTCFLEAGTIRHLDAVVEGLDEAGIRARVGTWVQGRAVDSAADQSQLNADAIALLENELSAYPANSGSRIAAWPILIGHNTNSDEVWQAAKSLADANNAGVSAHMSPYSTDPDWYLENTGKRPIEHLTELGVLGDNVSLTHVVHIDEHELELLAKTNTNVIHCPIAAMRDACGISAVGRFPEMAAAGINILLGSDGYSADLILAMKGVSAIFKDARQNGTLFSANDSLTMATKNAAKALQLEHEIGSLEVGKKADFVFHDTDRPEWRPLLNVVNQLIWSVDGRGVHSVWVDGKRLLDNYHSTVFDEAALYAQAQSAGEAIIKRSGLAFVSPWPVE